MKVLKLFLYSFFAVLFFISPKFSLAHPGNTASDGCHYCRTNCDSWGVAWNVRHCHNSGYTAPAPTVPDRTYVAPKPVYIPKITTSIDYKYEDVIFNTKYEDDPTLDIGKEKVKQEGIFGKKTFTYKITKTDGVETGRTLTKEEITTQPIDKIILRGTKQPQAAATGEVKGNTVAQEKTDPVAALIGMLIVFGIPAGIIWLIVRKLKKS